MSALARHRGIALFRTLATAHPTAPALGAAARPCRACRPFSTSSVRCEEAAQAAVRQARPETKVPGYIKSRLSSSCKDLLTSSNDDIFFALSAVYALRTQELRERALKTQQPARYRKSGVELELLLVASQLGIVSAMLPEPPRSFEPTEGDEAQPMPIKARTRKAASPRTSNAPKKPAQRKQRTLVLPPWDPNEPAPDTPWTHLPPLAYWPATFAKGKGFLNANRFFVQSHETAQKIVDGLNLGDGTGQKHTIVELYSGPGTLTRTLLEHPAVEKVIAIEDAKGSLQFLEQLKADTRVKGGAPGDRLHIQAGNAYHWNTYASILEAGALAHLEGRIPGEREGEFLDVQAPGSVRRTHDDPSWKVPAPITVVSQMPRSTQSEQLFAQLIAAIPVRQWMFAYGRVRMAFVTTESIGNRVQSEPGDKTWAKLGVMAQALVDVERVIESEELEPLSAHFWPPDLLAKPVLKARVSLSEAKYKLCMLILEPKLVPLLDHDMTDAFQYILRNVMVVRSKTVTAALKHAAPGAHNLLQRLHPLHPDMKGRPQDAIDPDCRVSRLTTQQFISLARAFEKWPFRPKHLFEEGRLADEDR